MRLAHPSSHGGARILRRGYNFTDGNDALGRLDAGLFFVAFERDPRTGFIPLQQALARHDVLNEYIVHTGSGRVRDPGRRAGDQRGRVARGRRVPRRGAVRLGPERRGTDRRRRGAGARARRRLPAAGRVDGRADACDPHPEPRHGHARPTLCLRPHPVRPATWRDLPPGGRPPGARRRYPDPRGPRLGRAGPCPARRGGDRRRRRRPERQRIHPLRELFLATRNAPPSVRRRSTLRGCWATT